jgi:ATP-binding cassette subfamily B protein
VALVFQDATMFNLTLRENIGFSKTVSDADLEKAIATAELKDFVDACRRARHDRVRARHQPVGGQKQRIMLARALALNPRVLLLDDFTARVDRPPSGRSSRTCGATTRPDAAVGDAEDRAGRGLRPDRAADGRGVLASGTHSQLLETCPEYVQIYDSQRSTRHYESVQA